MGKLITGEQMWLALVGEGERQCRPESYMDDLLVHDKKRLLNPDAPPRFGWVLREMGTELLDTRMSPDSLRGYMDHYRGNTDHFYYCGDFHSARGLSQRWMDFRQWEQKLMLWNHHDYSRDQLKEKGKMFLAQY